MNYLKSYNNFSNEEELNEGWKNWALTFSTLVSLGFLSPAKADNLEEKDKMEIVNSLTQSENDTLSIVNTMMESNFDNSFTNVNKVFEQKKINTVHQEKNLFEFIDYLNNPNSLITANMFLIDIPIPVGDVVLDFKTPLYTVRVKPNSKTSLSLSSTLGPDFSINMDISRDLKITFMKNPLGTTLGFRKTF
jgi:hypothetical protein